jgi:clathrin heavy chain
VEYYETRGHFDELIALLEQGMNLERAHQGIFTQLGVCYCKYKTERVMEHIKTMYQRLNIPTLLGACQKNQLWPEAVFLYKNYDQYDNAIDVMIDHSPVAWDHKVFKEILLQVPNTEVYYKAIDFYLNEHPLLLNDLLIEVSSKLDHSRVVSFFRRQQHLPLIDKYLFHVQHNNLLAVNEAVNELLLQEEKAKQLRESIVQYGNFDQLALALKLKSHPRLEFRRLAIHLYKVNKRWDRSIELSKEDKLWADAMETVAESRSQELAENLLSFFVEKNERDCFGAMLYTCYDLIRPDVVLELAWRYNLTDYAMPFMIQSFRHMNERISALYQKLEDADKEKKKEEEQKIKDQPAQDSHLNPSIAIAVQHALNPMNPNIPLLMPSPNYQVPQLMPNPSHSSTTNGLGFL